MIDTDDYVTAPLPLDAGEPASQEQAAPEQAAPAKRKSSPRAKYTDAFVLKCTANRDPDSASVMLLTALRGCGIAHKSVDEALGIPEGTVLAYLTKNAPQVDTETGEVYFDDARAFEVFDMLYALVSAQAFSGTGLHITGVLTAMLSFKAGAAGQ